MSKRAISPGGRDADDRAQSAPDVPSGLRDGGTDWERVLAMTDEEAYQNALADEDSQPMTPQQLARMRRAPNPKAIRDGLGLTQKEFARQFQIAVGTLRDWEQGLHVPDTTATAYLRVIEREPEAVLRALHPSASGHGIHVRAVAENSR
jgi:putative transcriptional regulator